ncbi:hypothetical protein M5Y73_23350 [Citrobacter cronae]|nr:hypothetical protein [Citrobacter cronae]
MQERDLGSMGETLFMQLCATVGLICNSSSKDSAGWDFIVDFPTQFATHPMIDKSASPIECKVQVKATDGSSKKVQITLSNMMRLCRSKLPAFFFFIEYNGENNPQAVYIRHVDKNIIFNTLKRARENSVAKNKKQLNKINLTVTFNDSHKLAKITGENLKKTIESYLPEGMEVYTENKINDLKKLGYENGGYSLTFQTKENLEYADLIEASLGWRDKAKISNIKCFDNRFDISIPLEEMSSTEAELSFGFESFERDATLKVTNVSSRKSIRIQCKIYTSPLSINAPDEHVKVRLKSSYFDILFSLKTGILTYRFDSSDNTLNLFEIRDNLTLMLWVYEQEDILELELNIPTQPESLTLSTNINKDAKQDISLIENCIQALTTVENAIAISNQLGIEAQIKTTINDLTRYSERTNIIGDLFRKPNEIPAIKLAFKEKIESPPEKINACCLIVLSTKLGDFKLYVITTITGKGVYYENEYLLSNPHINIEDIEDCYYKENITERLIKKTDLIAAKYTNENDDITFINMFHDNNKK